MRNKIYHWVEKHERLHYIIRCFHHMKDEAFVRDVNNESLFALRMVSKGEKHKGKILYRIEDDTSGFFANFLFVLGDMWFADTLGMYPVVIWGDRCPYYEKNGVNGVFNAWEYYFKQYGDLHAQDLDSAYRMSDVKKDVRRLAFGIENGYCLTEKYFLEMGRIMKKYIRLKPDIEAYINGNINGILEGKRTLGVQIRMGGMLANFNGHPIVPSLDEYVEAIKSVYKKGYGQIFLATDDKRALGRMKEEFGGCLVYYPDTTRVDGEYSTYCANTEKKLHKYQCGLEVLRDMYTLAGCDGFVGGLSQVGNAAQIAKIASGTAYEDLLILDKGINKNLRTAPDGKEELARAGKKLY
ncbi:hypothetical protein D7V86_18570 [bacterium D16-51]|nr:hypothetical protein D7V96_14410 [bacterium D16-59]RKI56973.1 hypothetical protein D7V86_18570 [bacterium D16-51]